MPDALYATIVFENPGPAIGDKASGLLPGDESRQYKARRAHTKSRKGCSTCKTRHLKCDERRPSCGQCIQSDRACSFASAPITPKSTLSRGRLQPPKMSNQLPTDFMNGYYDGTSELWKKIPGTISPAELLDHFMHTTHHLWIGGPSCQTIIQQHGPRLAVEAPYLRFAILSFSAYHFATVRRKTKDYELAGAIYYSCALQSYTNALQNPGAAELDALLACSVLLAMIAYRNLISSPKQHGPSEDKESFPNITGLQVMTGFSIIKNMPALQPKLGQSVLIGRCMTNRTSCPKSVVEYSEKLTTLERLERFCNADRRSTALEGVYDVALMSLRHLMLSEVGDDVIATYCLFVRGFDSRFVSLLEKQDPKALLLLCYWHAMGARIRQWWMVDSAQRDGMKLLNTLRENPSSEIQELLKFPLACLESSQSADKSSRSS